MAGIDKRGSYTPRRTREQKAYRLVQVGAGASVVAVAGIVLDIVGVIGLALPLVAILVAIACFVMFRTATGRR
jgi:hypothetical protein